MRTYLVCTKCAEADHSANSYFQVDLNDQLFFDVHCPKGHHIRSTIELTKYSLLFDFGILALEDGYYREAVGNFATSVERLYEFFIRVICKKHSVDIDSFDKAWSNVSSQSERQIGAIHFLFLIEKREPFPALAPKRVKFRNDVTHKGYLPSHEETLEYARAVHDHMIALVNIIGKE